jgi:hypothetical protein
MAMIPFTDNYTDMSSNRGNLRGAGPDCQGAALRDGAYGG